VLGAYMYGTILLHYGHYRWNYAMVLVQTSRNRLDSDELRKKAGAKERP
jgi:hypothetical protein